MDSVMYGEHRNKEPVLNGECNYSSWQPQLSLRELDPINHDIRAILALLGPGRFIRDDGD